MVLVSVWMMASLTLAQVCYSEVNDHVPGQLMVMISPKVSVERWCSDMSKAGVSSIQPVQRLSQTMNLWLVEFDPAQVEEHEAFLQAERLSSTQVAQFNHTNLVQRNVPNDPEFDGQWAFYNDGTNGGSGTADIDALAAWNITTGGVTPEGDTIVVAVIDGGFSIDHEDLESNIFTNHNEIPANGLDDDNNGYVDDVHGWNTYTNSGTPSWSNHGTHVAGTVGAVGNNGIGLTGVNWNVKVLPISGSSSIESTVLASYAYVLDMRRMYNNSGGAAGAYVVSTNASFGVDYGDPVDYPLWCAMYDSLGLAGVLSAGATANININIDVTGDVPTACGSNFLLSVTNTTSSDVKNSGAAYGLSTIDLGAPGTNIRSTTVSGYGNLTGTSMATPHVAGAIALMYSAVCPDVFDELSNQPAQLAFYIRNQLLNEGVDELSTLDGLVATGGRLNLHKAVLSVVDTCAQVLLDVTSSTCGNCDGSIEATALGGQAPFTYSWSTGDTSSLISDLCPGVYSLTLTDVSGEALIQTAVVSDEEGPTLSVDAEAITCAGAMDGSAVVALDSHTVIVWSDGSLDAVRSNISAGLYSVTGIDTTTACSTLVAVLIEEPDSIQATLSGTIPSPYSATNGSVHVQVSGGVAPYSMEWFDGSTDTVLANVPTGTYGLTVTDANGCKRDFSYYLGWPTGAEEVERDVWHIYPNPTNGTLFLSGVQNGSEFLIYDALGRVHMKGKVGHDPSEVSLEGLNNGLYFIQVEQEGVVRTERIQLMR